MRGSREKAADQMTLWKSRNTKPDRAVSSHGCPYATLTTVQTVEERGPILLQDTNLVEHFASFDRERIPERVVHAKGAGMRSSSSNRKYSRAHCPSKYSVIFNVFCCLLALTGLACADEEGTFVINHVSRATPQHYDNNAAIDINCQRVKDKTMVFSIETTATGREIVTYQLDDGSLEQNRLFQTPAPDAVSVDMFRMKSELFAFTTVNHEPHVIGSTETIDTGSTLYHVNFSNKTFDKLQTIHMPFAKSTALWSGMGSESNGIFLAIAPEKAVVSADKTSYKVVVPLYHWQGGYFDYVSELTAKNPQSIQHFAMFSHDYLAVANYQDDTGSTSIHSEIFKYHHKESRFVSFQRIQTYGAKDIRHFTFSNADERRQEHFIAIANSCKKDENGQPQFWVQSTIMKFGRTRFLPFKRIYTYGALQVLPVKHDNKFFLAMADFHGIRLFQYNGWTFVETFSTKFATQLHSSTFSIKMRDFNTVSDGKSYFTVAAPTQQVENGMFGVSFETRNDYRRLVTSVETWCKGAKQQIEQENLFELEARLNSAPKVTDSSVVIRGELKFVQGVTVGQLKSQSLRMGRGRSLDLDKFNQMVTAEREFKKLSNKMNEHHDKLINDVVWVNKHQEINSIVHFNQDVVYENENMEVKDLTVKHNMGPIQVNDHLDNLIFLNQAHQLNKIVTDNVIANDASLTSLNGRPLNDYALRHPVSSDKQIFTGSNTFESPIKVVEEVQVGQNFAGLSFTQPEFLLYEGNQTFPGATMELTDSRVANLYTRMLNGVDVFTMFADAVPLSGGVIKASKTFTNGNVKMNSARVSTINKLNVDSLYNDAIYTKGPGAVEQEFKNPVYFENLEIDQITPVQPNINEQYDVNFNFHKIAGEEYKVKNMKLTEDTSINHLHVKNQLNNVKVFKDIKNDKLDLLLRNANEAQHVKSKVLQSVHFTQNVEASELVDGVHLASWSHEQKIQLTENEIRGILTVPGNVEMKGGLFVDKSFQQGSSDVLHVLQNSARTDAETLPGSCNLHFDKLQVMGNSDIHGKVNNVLPSQWVINSDKSTQLEITGEKVFTGPVHFAKNVGANALFGKAEGEQKAENLLQVFPTLLLDGVDQTIEKDMTFGGKFRVNQASCPNAILDSVSFEHLLLKKGGQTVQVETNFRTPLVAQGDVNVLGDVSTALVNGININSQLKDTLRTNGDEVGVQRITGAWQFDELNVRDNAQVLESFSSSDVSSLYGDIIRKDSKTIRLKGVDLFFGKGALMSHVDFLGRINGIPSTDWGEAWLLSEGNQVVETKVEFAGPVSVNAFQAPTVNGVDINHFSENILRVDQDETLQGSSLTFKSPVTTEAGISMPNGVNVNGIDLANDVLLKDSESIQTISGQKNFLNGVTVQGNLFVNEISGFDVANFANLAKVTARSEDASSPSSLHIKGNLELEQEPEVTSTLNDKSWNDMRNSIWMRREDVTLTSPVKFNSLKLNQGGSIGNSGKLNNLDLKTFQENYASKTRPQKWTGEVTLKNVENVEMLKSLRLENDGKFNDVELSSFYDSVLRYTGDQTINGRDMEAENLVVTRLSGDDVQINDVRVQDFMTISGPNQVTSSKTLKNLQAQSLVLSDNTVMDGVNLGDWNVGAVRRTGTNVIQGPLEFESLVANENVVVDGFVDAVKLDLDNVVTTDKDQVIPNRVTIKQPKSRKNSIKKSAALKARQGIEFKGKLNDKNVQDSISKMVFKNDETMEPIVIKGGTLFNAPVVLSQVKTQAFIEGQNVTAMMDTMTRAHDQVHSKGFKADEQYSKLLSMTKRMMAVSEKRAVFLDYYVLTQTIKVPALYVKTLKEVGYPVIAIGFKKSDGVTTENWWSYSAAVDYYQLQIGNRVQFEGIVTDIAELSQASANSINKNSMFAFAVNSESEERPAHAAVEMIESNDVHNVELNKSPDKLSKAFILKSVDVGTPNMRPAISQVIFSHGFKSVQSFTVVTKETNDGLTSCMAAATNTVNEMDSSVKVFCVDKASGAVEAVQEMNLDSPSLITSTRVLSTDTTLLAILTRSGHRQPEGLLEVWSHGHQSGRSKLQRNFVVEFQKQSCLPVFNAVSLDSLSTDDGKTFLAVASGALTDSEYQGSVFVYRLSRESQQFKKVQTVNVNHPVDVKLQLLKSSNEVVMYVLSQSVTNNVQVYKRQGLSGWSLVHQFTSENGKRLEVADFTMDGIYRAQLLVTSPTQTKIYAAEFMGVNTVIEEELMESSSSIQSSASSSLREFSDFDL